MEAYRLAVKFFIQDPSKVELEEFVPEFHRWIQSRALDDHLLIDVGDYKHVHEGPGIVLVSHEANIYADLGGGRLGLLYVRKQPLPGFFADRLRAVFKYALQSAALLEDKQSLQGRVQFRTDELIFRINDRLHAPNAQETFDRIKPDLEAFLRHLYGTPTIELTYRPHPENPFEVEIRLPESLPIHTLLERAATA